MAADIQVAVGIDASLARRGREQFVSDCEAMVAAYAKVTNAMKAPASQTAGAGVAAIKQQKDALVDLIAVNDRAAAAIMAGDARRIASAEKAAAAQQKAVANLTATYAPHLAELQKLAKDEKTLNDLRAQGAISVDVHAQALGRLQQRQATVTAEGERMANGAKMSTYAMRNLSYQINDVVSGLAMGQSPFMILTQQGGQFIQVAQDAGIGIGRIALGLTAVAAAGVALIGPAIHLANMRQEAKELDIALKAVGNTAAGIGASLQARAAQTAASGISSRGDVTQAFKLAATSATTRNLDPAQIQQLTKAAEGFAFVTGVTLPEAQTTLIKTLSGGYNEMLKLANLYPMATAAELDQLRIMAQHGDQAGMLAKSIELLNRKFGDFAAEGASTSTRAFHQMGVAWDTLMDKMSQSRPYVAALEYISDVSRKITNGLILPQTTLFGKMTGAGKEATGGQSLSFEMPPPPAGTAAPATGANDVVSATTAKANAIMDAAQKEAAAYRLVGQAREKALISAQYDRQIAEAQGDAFKVAELQAQKMAALTLVGVQAMADFNNEQKIAIRQSMELADAWKSGNVEAIRRASITGDVAKKAQELGISEEEARKRIEDRNRASAAPEIEKGLRLLREQVDLSTKLATLEGRGNVAGARAAQVEAGMRTFSLSNPTASAEQIAAQRKLLEEQSRLSDVSGAFGVRNQSPAVQKQMAEAELSRLSQVKDAEGNLILTQEDIARRKMAIDQAYIDGEIARLEATRNWSDGAEAALKRYANDATNYGAQAGRVVTNSLDSAANAFTDFSMGTKTAGDAFRDFALGVVRDLIKMQTQAAMSQAVSSSGGFGGILGSLGGMFGFGGGEAYQSAGNATAISSGDYTSSMSSFSGAFASGTDSAPPGLALVGENGPELMQMGGGERIYPNDQTRAILNTPATNDNSSGRSTSITNHFSGVTAEDAQTIAEKIAKQVSDEDWQKRGPALADHATNKAVAKVADYSSRGGRYSRLVRGA